MSDETLPDDPLAERARAVLDTNRYLVLGTSEADGRPRVSPVYFTHHQHRRLYWVSSPHAQHSRNIADRPAVSVVIFDSTAAVGAGRATYVDATAAEVGPDELGAACLEAFPSTLDGGAVAFGPAELSGDAGLRLYRAVVDRAWVHVAGRDPNHGTGIDRRVEVAM